MIASTTPVWEILQALGISVGAGVALIGLLITPLRWISRKTMLEPFKKWHTDSTGQMLETWGDKRLFSPNGGNSLYDVAETVKGVDSKVEVLTGRFDEHTNDEAFLARLEAAKKESIS
jgi:hypothetical protein